MAYISRISMRGTDLRDSDLDIARKYQVDPPVSGGLHVTS
jgi:hypothetical protein